MRLIVVLFALAVIGAVVWKSLVALLFGVGVEFEPV